MKKVFISQRMRGHTDEEIAAERKAVMERVRAMYKKDGKDVEFINSFFEDFDGKPLSFLAKSLSLLADADVAVFCDGWEKARGCRIEHLCCEEYDIKMLHE